MASPALRASLAGPETEKHRKDDEVVAFLRRILEEARAKRRDMVTHYTIDDLRVALGFARPKSVEGTTPEEDKHG